MILDTKKVKQEIVLDELRKTAQVAEEKDAEVCIDYITFDYSDL